jgi:hypothetical protein
LTPTSSTASSLVDIGERSSWAASGNGKDEAPSCPALRKSLYSPLLSTLTIFSHVPIRVARINEAVLEWFGISEQADE